MVSHIKKNNTSKENLIDDRPIQLVFSGGGAKGIAYAGVAEAMHSSGVLKKVNKIAGSSAGAMTAALIATGITSKRFNYLSLNTNFKDLLGKKGVSFPIPLRKDGEPLYEMMGKEIANNIHEFFRNNDISGIVDKRLGSLILEQEKIIEQTAKLKIQIKKLQQLSDNKLVKQLKNLSKELEELTEREQVNKQNLDKINRLSNNNYAEIHNVREKAKRGDKILFKDLGLLEVIAPETFKGLLVTAVKKSNGESIVFSSVSTPDVEIAKAVHASAAIPVVFKSVEINGEKYVDGGYRKNIPVDIFKKNSLEDITERSSKIRNAKNNGKMIVFAFGNTNKSNDDANLAVYSGKKIRSGNIVTKLLVDIIYKKLGGIGGKFKFTEDVADTYKNLRRNSLSTVILETKPVNTLDFNKAKRNAQYLAVKGQLATLNHLANWEINEKPVPGLAERTFLLDVYEENNKKSANKNVDYKSILLKFCESSYWKGNDVNKESNLRAYINLLALDGKRKSIKGLVNVLNKPTTPDVIKKEFAAICSLKLPSTKKINYTKIQFKETDFEEFTKAHKLKKIPMKWINDNVKQHIHHSVKLPPRYAGRALG